MHSLLVHAWYMSSICSYNNCNSINFEFVPLNGTEKDIGLLMYTIATIKKLLKHVTWVQKLGSLDVFSHFRNHQLRLWKILQLQVLNLNLPRQKCRRFLKRSKCQRRGHFLPSLCEPLISAFHVFNRKFLSGSDLYVQVWWLEAANLSNTHAKYYTWKFKSERGGVCSN